MSNLIGNLLTNANALNVHSLGVQTAGNNISNVNDPAYARQRVLLRDGGDYQIGTSVQQRGIEALGIEHIRNSVLDAQLLSEQMTSASYEEQAQLLSQLETSINDIIDRQDLVDTLDGNKSENLDSGGIATALDDFLNTFAELASDPGSESIKEVVFERAQILVDQFNLAYDRLTSMDETIGDQIYDQVDEVNSLLDEIAEINRQIAQFEAQEGIMAPDLRDQRQEYLEELAQYMDFETSVSGINPSMIDIKARNTTGTGPTAYTTLISGGSVNGELAYEEFAADGITPLNKVYFRELGSTTDVELKLAGGAIHGALEVKTDNLVKLEADFDTLASAIVSKVNTAYQGDPADVTNAFFNATGITAATIAIDSSLISTTTANGQTWSYYDVNKLKTTNENNGGNDLALAIGELVSTKTIGVDTTVANSGSTFSEYIAQFSARVGAEVQGAEMAVENQAIVTNFLTTQRESYSGVNLDEEMADLLRFQRAFQGTSRVISTLDQMLQQVVAGLIR